MVSECPLVKIRGGTVLREDWKPRPLAFAQWAISSQRARPTTVESVARDEGDGTRARGARGGNGMQAASLASWCPQSFDLVVEGRARSVVSANYPKGHRTYPMV